MLTEQQLTEIIARHGTPLYIYDCETIKKQYRALRAALPVDFRLLYSVKANPLLWLCRYLRELGCGMETASAGEILLALEAGCPPERIVFTSPGKTSAELEYALQQKIFSINLESEAEAELLQQLATKHNTRVNVAVRVNPAFTLSRAGMQMTGVASQFGIDSQACSKVIPRIKKLSCLNITGLHIYLGTQVLDAGVLVNSYGAIFELALEFRNRFNLPLKWLDLGGGFGVPYFEKDQPLDLAVLQQGLAGLWQQKRSLLAGIDVYLESGRFLVADSAYYCTRVLYLKESKGRKYAICDGGARHNAVAAFLNRRIRNNFPVSVLGGGGEKELVTLCGPQGNSADILGQDLNLPRLSPGDIVLIAKSGAYGQSFSPVLRGGYPTTAEVAFCAGETIVMRERGGRQDVLKNCQLLPPDFEIQKSNG